MSIYGNFGKQVLVSGVALLAFGTVTTLGTSFDLPGTEVSASTTNGYSNGLYYTNGSLANGYINDGQHWYLFKNGQKLSEIQQYMGGYYYFDKTTHLRTDNAFRDEWGNTYYFGGDGRAVTGLQTINGNKYYFGDDGTYTLRKSQWLTLGGAKYYATADGSFASDVTKIGNTYYYFNPSTKALSTKRDYIQARWGSWYLVGSDGTVQSGLQSWAGNYYYFDPSTYLKVTNKTVNINGTDWYFDGSGVGTKKSSSADAGQFSAALNRMNQYRQAYGLQPVSYDAGLARTAQSRAQQMAGTVDQAHYNQTYGKEVVAIQFGSGATAMEAWFNETNMSAAPGHRNWILNSSITRVGFGYDAASQTFVGEAK